MLNSRRIYSILFETVGSHLKMSTELVFFIPNGKLINHSVVKPEILKKLFTKQTSKWNWLKACIHKNV